MEDIRSLTAMAENMRRLRKIKHLTQEELAYRAGLHPYFIGLIERKVKAPSLRSVDKIARALAVSVAELVTDEGQTDVELYGAVGREAAHLMDVLPREKADALLVLMKFVAEKFIETGAKRKAKAAKEEAVWVTKKTAKKKSKRQTA